MLPTIKYMPQVLVRSLWHPEISPLLLLRVQQVALLNMVLEIFQPALAATLIPVRPVRGAALLRPLALPVLNKFE